jgi:hypothetical protein
VGPRLGLLPEPPRHPVDAALHAWFDKHLAQRKVATGPSMELFLADTSSFSEARGGARTEILDRDALPLNETRS